MTAKLCSRVHHTEPLHAEGDHLVGPAILRRQLPRNGHHTVLGLEWRDQRSLTWSAKPRKQAIPGPLLTGCQHSGHHHRQPEGSPPAYLRGSCSESNQRQRAIRTKSNTRIKVHEDTGHRTSHTASNSGKCIFNGPAPSLAI